MIKMNKIILAFLIVFLLWILVGCTNDSGTSDYNLKCDKFCRSNQMNFEYVETSAVNRATCICSIPIENIPYL